MGGSWQVSCSCNIFAMLLDSLRNLSLEPFGFDARVLRNLVHCLGLLPKVVPRVVPMFTCKVTRHQQAQIYLLRRHQVVRTITNKPGLVIPTNPLVVVVQTQHQWTVTLPPPTSAEGLSSSKIPAGFDKMGPQYKAVSEVSGKHKNQIWTVFSEKGQRRASFVV